MSLKTMELDNLDTENDIRLLFLILLGVIFWLCKEIPIYLDVYVCSILMFATYF